MYNACSITRKKSHIVCIDCVHLRVFVVFRMVISRERNDPISKHDGTCHVRLVLFPTDTYSSSVVGFFYFERLRYVVDYPLFIFHRALFEWLMDERNVQGNHCECSSYYSAAWYEVTPVFQVGLLLVMIWFMSYLIYYWFVIAKHTVLFVILTFIYLAILDTFTTYDASFAVIRAFVISLISLGITHFMGVIQREVIEIAR